VGVAYDLQKRAFLHSRGHPLAERKSSLQVSIR
jgi:hypothetical protein